MDALATLIALPSSRGAGFGYDIAAKRRYAVVPFATLVQGFNNGLYLDGERATGASQMKLLRFGVGGGPRR